MFKIWHGLAVPLAYPSGKERDNFLVQKISTCLPSRRGGDVGVGTLCAVHFLAEISAAQLERGRRKMAANEKSAAESIECFIEGQTFSRGRMIWLPFPFPHLLSLSSTGETQED
jgi:hypothetical protein